MRGESVIEPNGRRQSNRRESAPTSEKSRKKSLRRLCWQQLLATALLVGPASSQGPNETTLQDVSLMATTMHRHRREMQIKSPVKGVDLKLWSFNVNAPPMGYLQECVSQASLYKVDILLIQSTRWTQEGPGNLQGYRIFYSSCTGLRHINGLTTAVRIGWLPKHASITGTEIQQGRILAVRVRANYRDVTILNVYAPQPGGSGADERPALRFWEELGKCVKSLPQRTSPILGGDFNSHVGGKVSAGHIRPCGAETENEMGESLRELAENCSLHLPLTFLSGRRSGWTWQRPDGNVKAQHRIDHWLIPVCWRHRVNKIGSGVMTKNPIQPPNRVVDHRLVELQVKVPSVEETLERPGEKSDFRALRTTLLREKELPPEARVCTAQLQERVQQALDASNPGNS